MFDTLILVFILRLIIGLMQNKENYLKNCIAKLNNCFEQNSLQANCSEIDLKRIGVEHKDVTIEKKSQLNDFP